MKNICVESKSGPLGVEGVKLEAFQMRTELVVIGETLMIREFAKSCGEILAVALPPSHGVPLRCRSEF